MLVFRHLPLFVRVAAPLVLPANAVLAASVLAFAAVPRDGAAGYVAVAGFVLVAVLYSLVLVLAIGACVKAAADIRRQAETSAHASLRALRERLKPFLLLAAILFFVVAPGLVLYAIARTQSNLAAVMIVPILVALGLATMWSVSIPVFFAENAGVKEALKRSRELVRGRFMHALGSVFFGGTLALFASVLALILVSIIAVEGSATRFVIGLGGWAVGELLTLPLVAAYATLLYDGLRIFKEGSGLVPAGASPR